MKKLPPLNALRAFEAVSRLGGVSKAAEELCVSQGAVSQQLRKLEDHFGRQLFHRSANSLTLTDLGEEFAAAVQQGFADITEAATRLSGKAPLRQLNISVPPTLGTKWLLPKLGDFYHHHPDVSVVLKESPELVTFKNDGFDAAIRFSDGNFDDLNADLLITIRKHAVASPEYIDRHGRLESLQHPDGHCLIDYQYDSKKISSQHIGWQDVVDADLQELDIRHLSFPDGLQALNAAAQGQGIALAARYLCADEIEAGELQLLGDSIFEYRNRFYFVSPKDVRPDPALDDFRAWLLDISEAYR